MTPVARKAAAGARQAGASSPARRRRRSGEGGFAALFIAPTLVFLGTFGLFPLAYSVWLSLRNYKLTQPWSGFPFVGLANYARIITDANVLHAIKVTVIYIIVTVALQTLCGLIIALLLHPPYRGRTVARTLMLLPWTLSPVLAGVMWKWMFDGSRGLVNDVLARVGLVSAHDPVLWLSHPQYALWVVVAAAVWGASSYVALILLAGLQGIPEELYEAATIDGASPVRSFFAVTLPLLRPAILVAVTLRSLGALQAFDLPYAMTGGGPGNATETLPMYIHNYTFRFLDFGYGSALALVLMGIGIVFSVAYLKLLSSGEVD